ncbi:hypothetical protein NLG97_g4291 [Lecanicillium saksenae]|uniref:Uncharacterized protein n=1 Tax=Lecanicillium saksenae TaxID=468837 RepID=A0ACC1QXE4_9HYPO|nr:hypothetical protein NLG97_g4291 [Lecanicillium saksenae]
MADQNLRPDENDGCSKEPVIVRLESATEATATRFDLTFKIQTLAHKQLTALVPPVLQSGKVKDSEGREYCFSVVKFVPGPTVESVWAELDDNNKELVIKEIIAALKVLHSQNLNDRSIQDALEQATTCQAEDPESHSVKITSRFPELGTVVIEENEMDQWVQEAVLCHNDLTPRNLICGRLKKANQKRIPSIDWLPSLIGN